LSIINVELIPYIFGPQGLPKGPRKINLCIDAIFAYSVSFTVWDGRLRLLTSQGYHSLIGIRDLRRHAQLRKPWNQAFQSAALIGYEDILVDRAAQLMTHLQKLCDDEVSVDLANLISLFAFVYRL
jgi:hypothetical protein